MDKKNIDWSDPEQNPLDNMKEIWITRGTEERAGYKIWLDKPTLEEDGVFRSGGGDWGSIDFKWFPVKLKKGECKHYKLVEDETF